MIYYISSSLHEALDYFKLNFFNDPFVYSSSFFSFSRAAAALSCPPRRPGDSGQSAASQRPPGTTAERTVECLRRLVSHNFVKCDEIYMEILVGKKTSDAAKRDDFQPLSRSEVTT